MRARFIIFLVIALSEMGNGLAASLLSAMDGYSLAVC